MTAPAIFYDSTPADNYCAPWRCASPEVAVAVCKALCPDTAQDAYACHDGETKGGRVRLWVGLHDNRAVTDHATRIAYLCSALKLAGYDARITRTTPTLHAIRLLDRVKR